MENDMQDKPVEKIQDELNKERAERFAKNPESFIECSELICAAIRRESSPIGVSVMIGNSKRSELNQAQAELNHRIDMCRRAMDMQQAKEASNQVSGILVPGNGKLHPRSFIDGIRNMGRKN